MYPACLTHARMTMAFVAQTSGCQAEVSPEVTQVGAADVTEFHVLEVRAPERSPAAAVQDQTRTRANECCHQQLVALESSNLDWRTGVAGQDARRLQAHPAYQVLLTGSSRNNYYNVLAGHQRSSACGQRVRQAFSYTMNRQRMVDWALAAYGRPASTAWPRHRRQCRCTANLLGRSVSSRAETSDGGAWISTMGSMNLSPATFFTGNLFVRIPNPSNFTSDQYTSLIAQVVVATDDQQLKGIVHDLALVDDVTVWTSEIAGGGGFGDPRQRPRDRVQQDVRNGLVSPERAASEYGLSSLDRASGSEEWGCQPQAPLP